MLKTLKKLTQTQRKSQKKNRFLKRLVSVYSSPWSKKRGTFRDFELDVGKRDEAVVRQQFWQDIAAIVADMQLQPIDLNDDPFELALNLLLADDADINNEALEAALSALPVTQAAKPSDTAIDAILSRLFDPDTMVFHYELDFVDEVVPNIRSRYIGEDGLYIADCSERILKALWVLCDQRLGDFDVEKLSTVLHQQLGFNHPYLPKRFTREEFLKGYLPDALADEMIAMRCADNPERFAEICGQLFEEVNARAPEDYAERDISLIYGYENNHHLILRTVIGLINDGKITPEDNVLILGPRYSDEVLFFREILGLPKTIGLDLRDEGDTLVKGDMHNIPYADDTFKFVFGANVLEYTYNIRTVVNEITRVTQRPGYVSFIMRTNRAEEPTPIGRMTIGNVDTATSVFYEHPHRILAKDPGLTSNPDKIGHFPSYVIELQ